jgi:replicative DNA helicase
MSSDERLSGALQENVLTLLCFDLVAAPVIRGVVEPALFESQVYREIAQAATAFLDLHHQPVGEHLPDVLEELLTGKDTRKANLLKRAISDLHASRETVNRDYVLASLNKFVHQQSLKQAILKAVDAIEANQIDEAERALEAGLKSRMVQFEAGLTMDDARGVLRFFDTAEDFISTGIAELDRREIGPRPKELFLFIAPPKKGKSWGMVHLAKHAARQRKKVLIVTLEMSEERYAQRLIQSIFSITKRQAKTSVAAFKRDGLGRFMGVDVDEVMRPSLADADMRRVIAGHIESNAGYLRNIRIKQFPTRALTPSQLDLYLDTLERVHGFIPHMVIVDYPDLMKVSSEHMRTDIGQVFQDIRGIGVSRNIAMVAPTQGNRIAAKAKLVDDTMVAEDFSKIATADNVVTYSQTAEEKRLGLARLFVSNGRNDEDKITILLSQAYAMGQFALDSVLMPEDYWRIMERETGKLSEEDDDAQD